VCWGWGMRRKWEHRAGLLGENAARCGPVGKGERGSIVLLARPIEASTFMCNTPRSILAPLPGKLPSLRAAQLQHAFRSDLAAFRRPHQSR
jgi:hypothetical protein